MAVTYQFQQGSIGDQVTLVVSVQAGTTPLQASDTFAIEFADPLGVTTVVPATYTAPNYITVTTTPTLGGGFNFYIAGNWRAQGFIYPQGSLNPGKTSVAQISVLPSLS